MPTRHNHLPWMVSEKRLGYADLSTITVTDIHPNPPLSSIFNTTFVVCAAKVTVPRTNAEEE
jgi:hypothetical protein